VSCTTLCRETGAVLDYLCLVASHHQVYFMWHPFLRDAKDDLVLEAAVASNATHVVTFNPDIPLGLEWPARRVLSQFGHSRGVNSTAIDDERGGKMAKNRPLGTE
jgi:predicted nucleic acid-binding protein